MNDQDDIKPYRDPPPRWFSIGCAVIMIAIAVLAVFLLKKFGG